MNVKPFWKRTMFLLLLGMIFIFVPTAMAFEGREGDTVVIDADEVIDDDLYVGATNFTLNGTVTGDLFVGSETIIINGTVEGDLMAAGQSVIINGTVADDARIAGYLLELGAEAEVGGDLVSAGYSLQTRSGSTVGNDILFGGFQALLAGDVTGDAWVGANSLQLNGRIGGNLVAEIDGTGQTGPQPTQFMPNVPQVPAVPLGLTFGDDAEIGGQLSYRSPESIDVPADAVEGTVEFEEVTVQAEEASQNETLQTVWRHLRGFIALLLVGGLLLWLIPDFVTGLSSSVEAQPLPTLGWGAVVYFGIPILALVLLFAGIALALLFGAIGLGNIGGTFIWIAIGVLVAGMIAFVLVLLYLTKIIVGYLTGRLILEQISPEMVQRPFIPLILGLVIIMVLIAIPWLGALINWLIAIAGVGAIWLHFRSRRSKAPAAKSAV